MLNVTSDTVSETNGTGLSSTVNTLNTLRTREGT